jgi:hypothetical protein
MRTTVINVFVFVCVGVLWRSATFPLSKAALRIRIFVEGRRIKLAMSGTGSEAVFLYLEKYSWYSLENG